MVGFLDGAVLGMVLFVPIFYMDGFGTITGDNNLAFQNQLAIRTPSASNLRVCLGSVIFANSSWVAPSSSA